MLKITHLFQGITGPGDFGLRPFGWSETWYTDGTIETGYGGLVMFSKFRARLLSSGISIIGARIHELGGPTKFFPFKESGVSGEGMDYPTISLNCRCSSADGKYKKYFQLRGLPDPRVVDGNYEGDPTYGASLRQFMTFLHSPGVKFQALDRTVPAIKINSISELGVVRCAAGGTFPIDSYVTLKRVRNTVGEKVSGTFRIVARASDTEFTLANWTGGAVAAVGTVTKQTFTYIQVGNRTAEMLGVTSRKVGRPFGQFRGRAMKF